MNPFWEIFDYLVSEAAVIMQAPVIHLTFAGLVFAAVWSSFKVRLAIANQTNQMREGLIAEFERKTESQSPDEAKQRIEDLQKRVAELEPSEFTENQMEKFSRKVLDQKGNVQVRHSTESKTARLRCRQISKALEDAGWRVISTNILSTSTSSSGLKLVTISQGRPDGPHEALANALAEAEIAFTQQDALEAGWSGENDLDAALIFSEPVE